MNGEREHIEKIWELPSKLTLAFRGRDGAPDRRDLKPVLRYEGQERVLGYPKVVEYSSKQVVLMLPKSFECHGLGRYEICLHTRCCRECDCVKLEFCGDCTITGVSSKPVEEVCDVRS